MRWGYAALVLLAACASISATPARITFAGNQMLLDGRAEFAIVWPGTSGRGQEMLGNPIHLYDLPAGPGRTRIIAYRSASDVWADSESCPELKNLAAAVRSARQPVPPPRDVVVICSADCGSPPSIIFNAEQGAVFKPGVRITDIYSPEDPASALLKKADALKSCWGSRAGFTLFDGE